MTHSRIPAQGKTTLTIRERPKVDRAESQHRKNKVVQKAGGPKLLAQEDERDARHQMTKRRADDDVDARAEKKVKADERFYKILKLYGSREQEFLASSIAASQGQSYNRSDKVSRRRQLKRSRRERRRMETAGLETKLNTSTSSFTTRPPELKSEATKSGTAKGNAKSGSEKLKVGAATVEAIMMDAAKADSTKADPAFLNKKESNERGKQDPPRRTGLHNFSRACYQLAVIQCLNTVQALVDHLRPQHSRVLEEIRLTGSGKHNLHKMACAQRKKGKGIRNNFTSTKAQISIQAYLGDVLERMQTAEPGLGAISAKLFCQAFGRLEKDWNGLALDGNTSQDAWDFLMRLLHRVEAEETSQGKCKDQSVVQKLFGGQTKSSYECMECPHEHTTSNPLLSLTVDVPRKNNGLTLQECIRKSRNPVKPAGYKCDGCGTIDSVTQMTKLEEAPQNLIINLVRTDSHGIISYEVRSFVEHTGRNHKDGHYTASHEDSSSAMGEREWDDLLPVKSRDRIHLTVIHVTSSNVALVQYSSNCENIHSDLMDLCLNGLNAAQHAAVTSPAAVLQILAPPGSGKTKTLTSRVAYLISHYGYKPWNILCLTFTVKSSREMRERISKLIGDGMETKLVLGTFHSVCWRYLVSYGHLIGLRKGFSVADTADTSGIIKRIVKRERLNIDPRKAQSRISSLKSRGIRPGEVQKQEPKSKSVDQQEFFIVFEAYQNQLNVSNLLDYDDLLLRCADLLRGYPECVSNVEVVLIDEFQDTNIVQFDLMTLFSAQHRRVTTVGDPDQSIYGWRSAEIKNLGRMQTEYPDTLLIHLEDNYRSSGAILLAASEIIEQDISRPPRPILPTHCPGTVPVLRKLPTAEIEAKWIVLEITRVMGMVGTLLTYADFAILLRSASLSRHIEAAMGKAGIPYRIVGGQKFFDRVEIKILLDYLRVISQPDNNDALSRIINVPARNIGVTTVKALLDEAELRKMTLWALVRDSAQGHITPRSKISKQGERAMGIFLNLILSTRGRLLDIENPSSPEELLKLVIKKLDFGKYLEKTYENDHEGRWANVEELLVQAAEFSPSLHRSHEEDGQDTLPTIPGLEQAKGNLAEEALSTFLANVALATELQRVDSNDEGDSLPQSQITISTIHAAKGLEWPVVFVPSAYEGSIPHSRAEDTDEERRLLYVAMTRAQALLYLSWPARNSQKEETKLSPFLCSKNVGHYLVSRGPSLHLGTVKDISQILRRQCPQEKDILEASKSLENHNDNLWLLEGEEELEAGQARWNNLNETSAAVRKRRKLDAEDDAQGKLTSAKNQHDLVHGEAATFLHTTTMQNRATFTYQSNGGFTTAAAQLHRTADAGFTAKQTRYSRDRPRLPSGIRNALHGDDGAANVTHGLNHRDQGNLLSLWTTKSTPNHASDSTKGSCPKPQRFFDDDAQRKKVQRKELEQAPKQDKIDGLHVEKPLGVIPPGLANHKMRSISHTGYLAMENDHPPKHYVFLSSSPPPIRDPSPPKINLDSNVVARLSSNVSLEKGVSGAEPCNGDIRPATTFHNTSVAQAKAGANHPKKTLGIRRSMMGWKCPEKKGFSIPIKP